MMIPRTRGYLVFLSDVLLFLLSEAFLSASALLSAAFLIASALFSPSFLIAAALFSAAFMTFAASLFAAAVTFSARFSALASTCEAALFWALFLLQPASATSAAPRIRLVLVFMCFPLLLGRNRPSRALTPPPVRRITGS